jgi:hypothetical protein
MKMKNNIAIIGLLLLMIAGLVYGFSCKVAREKDAQIWQTSTNWSVSGSTNVWFKITSPSVGTPFLTITNRYVQFLGGSCVVRVTDAQWVVITNHYKDLIRTNAISFYTKEDAR